jgi:hypothetical protein
VFPNPGFLGSVSSFSEFWNALARHDWVFHNSPFFVTPPFSKPLEIQATSRSGCSKIARIRALWGRSKNQFRVPQIQLRVPTIGYLFHNSADSGIEGDRVGRRRQGSSKATARSRGQGAELLATSSICAHRERLRHGCLPARISTTHGANHRGCNSTACRVSDFKLPNSKCQAMLRDGGNVSRATGPCRVIVCILSLENCKRNFWPLRKSCRKSFGGTELGRKRFCRTVLGGVN